jgi:hypothetical protein
MDDKKVSSLHEMTSRRIHQIEGLLRDVIVSLNLYTKKNRDHRVRAFGSKFRHISAPNTYQLLVPDPDLKRVLCPIIGTDF